MTLNEITSLPPDTSATDPEHMIGFRAGWRDAMNTVRREFFDAMICRAHWEGRELMIGDIVVGLVRKMDDAFGGGLFNGTTIGSHETEGEAQDALSAALIDAAQGDKP